MANKTKQQNKQTQGATKQTEQNQSGSKQAGKRKLLQTPERKPNFTTLTKKPTPSDYHEPSDIDDTSSQLNQSSSCSTPVPLNEDFDDNQAQAQPQHISDKFQQHISYMRSTEVDITELLTKQPIKFQDEFHASFGQPLNIQIHRISQSLKITSKTLTQHEKILQATSFFNTQVKITESPATTSHSPTEQNYQKCIIFNVSLAIDEDEIKQQTGAIQVKRIVAANKNLTHMVILSYPDVIPNSVNIGYLHFKTSMYIPRPIRCNRCQRFGHPTHACKTMSIKCSYCSGKHSYEQCTTKENNLPPHCSNCGANHSAAFNKCPFYLKVKEALIIRANEGMSYKEALAKASSSTTTTSAQVNNQPQYKTQQPVTTSDYQQFTELATQNKYDIQGITVSLKHQEHEIESLKATVASQAKQIETLTKSLIDIQTSTQATITSLFESFTEKFLLQQIQANDLIVNRLKELMHTEIHALKQEIEKQIQQSIPSRLPQPISSSHKTTAKRSSQSELLFKDINCDPPKDIQFDLASNFIATFQQLRNAEQNLTK